MKKHSLKIVVFLSGASVMILELVGSRVFSPYLGNSIFVWASLIGVVLGALSLGYWLGGRIADKRPQPLMLATILLTASGLVGLTALFNMLILSIIEVLIDDIRLASTIGAIILFGPATILLGMVTPYAVKLSLLELSHSARTVGNLYAISTVGSIAGTFATGFVLLALMGTSKILVLIAFLLVVSAGLTFTYAGLKPKAENIVGVLLVFIIFIVASYQLKMPGVIDIDTQYNRVWVYDTERQNNGKQTRHLFTSSQTLQSVMDVNNPHELEAEYTKYYRLIDHFNPNLQNVLVIGGGGYSYPKDFLNKHKTAKIDVVEIDPGITNIAQKYFFLDVDNPRLKIIHDDGRRYLNKTDKIYDAIILDAFLSFMSIPHHLTTLETMQLVSKHLSDDGVVIANVVSAIEGVQGKFFRAEFATYKNVFPYVYVIPVQLGQGREVQNLAIIATKKEPSFVTENVEHHRFLSRLWQDDVPLDMPILTDQFAPVENYVIPLIGS